jgi:predicted unusual protein kinase regulating ubiquinone biosynthesis (AarF/ABC1/UbiB family)
MVSIQSQVHKATLKNGREVVVKIMYPDVEKMFQGRPDMYRLSVAMTRVTGDMQTIKQFCAMAQPEHLPALKEIEKQFLTEFDYRYTNAITLAQITEARAVARRGICSLYATT